jgi:hypothetical protein
VLGMVLASKLPTATHIALLPMAMFALGSVIDLFRKKSPAPVLMASVLGFAGAAFVSFHHFFMLDVVMNFDKSHVKVIPLGLVTLVAMPMLLAYVRDRELSWQPARWLAVAVLTGSLVHLFLPGYTAERPRGMALVFSEVEGAPSGHLALESLVGRPDRDYANGHDFADTELNDGRLGTVRRPAREVSALDLPGVTVTAGDAQPADGGWRRSLRLEFPPGTRFLQLTFPEGSGLQKAWVAGLPALDTSLERKQKRKLPVVRLVYPPQGPLVIDLLTTNAAAFTAAVVTWHELPGVLTAPFMGNWPDDARPVIYGPRAEKIQQFEVPAVTIP